MIRRTWKPGASVSTMKQVMPSRPLLLSVRANVMPKSARSAPLMKCLVPFRTQPSPSRWAVVWIAPAGSLPPAGSVRPKKLRFLPSSSGIQIPLLLILAGLEQLREARPAEHAVAGRVQPGPVL